MQLLDILQMDDKDLLEKSKTFLKLHGKACQGLDGKACQITPRSCLNCMAKHA